MLLLGTHATSQLQKLPLPIVTLRHGMAERFADIGSIHRHLGYLSFEAFASRTLVQLMLGITPRQYQQHRSDRLARAIRHGKAQFRTNMILCIVGLNLHLAHAKLARVDNAVAHILPDDISAFRTECQEYLTTCSSL